MKYSKLSLVAVVILLSSCTTTRPLQPAPEAIEEDVIAPPSTATEKKAQPAVSMAAQELLEQAISQAEAGEDELAAASLQRAIRIEPDNPWLWHRFAVLRLQQARYSQAIELANRSIALAKGHHRLMGGNWRVIALALTAAGNKEAATQANKKADEWFAKP